MRLRVMRGYSQNELAKAAGLALNQIESFEDGKTTIDCSSLYVLAQALEVPLSCFYEGLVLPCSPEGTGLDIDPIAMLELFKMLKEFSALSAVQQRMVRDYIEALLESESGGKKIEGQ